MKKIYSLSFILSILFVYITPSTFGQCSTYPVPLEQRVSKAKYIVQGKVTDKHCYIDAATGNIYTLNKIKVAAWLKSANTAEEVYVITMGGTVGNKAMLVHPALELDTYHEYLLMLEEDNNLVDDKTFRALHPNAIQALPYAETQGSLTNERNYYHDLHYRMPKTEADLFAQISSLTGQKAVTPSGQPFAARNIIDNLFNNFGNEPPVDNVITTFSPNPSNAGTIVTSDFLNISGSGFGAAAGTVFYTNADDGGATFTATGVASDNTAWSATDITNKIARAAGTGPINVNGAMTSGSNLTINYSHININSTFSGFGTSTRQRYYLVNKNGSGGYTYVYNTAFAANANAKNSFERALTTWRCLADVNFTRSLSTSAVTTAVLDAVNIVVFDATLPAGTLGRATSRFQGTSTGACTLANTVWYLDELDMQFYPDPPVAGFPWEYGPALPSFSEYDFESVASHEIGHHVGLGHVISPGALMHFALANGSSVRTLSANDLAGASAKMTYSTAALCTTPAGVTGPMIAVTAGNCVVHVNLTDFNGYRKDEDNNILQWSTTQESNNKGFYVQRSKDGINFQDITFIKGAGNSNVLTKYNYTDNAGILPYHYRLRQINVDNKEKLSNIVFIDGGKTSGKVWASTNGDKVFVYIKDINSSTAFINIINTKGQKVLRKGITEIVTELNTTHLSKGVYYYQLVIDGKVKTGKIILRQ